MISFSLNKDTAPAVTILPTLEALVSVRVGSDPKQVWAFWERMANYVRSHTPYVFDNCHEQLNLEKANTRHHNEIRSALHQACAGPDTSCPIEWAYRTFIDVDHQDCLPRHECSLTIGRTIGPNQPRGISFRITVPDEKIESLSCFGLELARTWPGLWRWISIGYRFVPVQWYSPLMADALRIIDGRSKRYLGVDVGDIFGLYTSVWQNHLRTVNWMTFVCNDLASHFKDSEFIHPAYEFESLQSGIVFKMGPRPSLCDRNRKDSKMPFSEMDNHLRNIRAENLIFSPLWDMKHTNNWLNRFQNKEHFGFE